VALLIELGFDVNARPRTAPLHEAAMRGNIPIIRLLVEHGADPNVQTPATTPPRREGPSTTGTPKPGDISPHWRSDREDPHSAAGPPPGR